MEMTGDMLNCFLCNSHLSLEGNTIKNLQVHLEYEHDIKGEKNQEKALALSFLEDEELNKLLQNLNTRKEHFIHTGKKKKFSNIFSNVDVGSKFDFNDQVKMTSPDSVQILHSGPRRGLRGTLAYFA